MPELTMPEVRLTDIKLPEVDLTKVEMPKVDLSKVELPKVELPRITREQRGSGFPFLPITAFVAVIAAIGAALWLITSPTATTRVRDTADRTWRKVTRQATDMIRYDEDGDLASLLPNADQTRPSAEMETWPDTLADLGDSVAGDTASTTERPAL